MLRDMSRCILCRKCIRACSGDCGPERIRMAYGVLARKWSVDCDVPLDKEVCKDCGICIEYCPTSALRWPEGVKKRKAPNKKKAKAASVGRMATRERLLDPP